MANVASRPIPAVAGGASLRLPMPWSTYQDLGEAPNVEYAGGLCVVNPPTGATPGSCIIWWISFAPSAPKVMRCSLGGGGGSAPRTTASRT